MYNDFGTVTFDNVEYTLLEDADYSNRLFHGCYNDASLGDTYTVELSARAIGPKGGTVMIYWQFPEVKGGEPEDEGAYPWDKVSYVVPR